MSRPALSLITPFARPKALVLTNETGRKFTEIEGLGTIALSRDARANQTKLRAVKRRIDQAGSAARDAMEIHRLALAELSALRSNLHRQGLDADDSSVLVQSLDRTIALSQALLDEASTFVWEQTAVSGRLKTVQARLP